MIPTGEGTEPVAALVDAPCTVCRSTAANGMFLVSGHPIVRCIDCGHRYVTPRPDSAAIRAIYGDDYFANPGFETGEGDYFGYQDYFAERDNIEGLKDRVIARAERHVSVGKLLDIGCGPGFLVDVAKQRGWDAWGVDVNEHAVKWAMENGIDQVMACDALDLADRGPFDCMALFDVVEHFEDPLEEMSKLSTLLRPGGVVVLVTPDAGALVPRILGKRWMEMRRAPEHLHFFDVEGLSELLALSGFAPLEHHSIGKIASLHNLMSDMKFYAPGPVGALDSWMVKRGWGDINIEVDPVVKFCIYAKKVDDPATPGERRIHARHQSRKVTKKGFRRTDLGHNVPPGTIDGFRDSQRTYWEGRERFRDAALPGPRAFAEPKLAWATKHVEIGPDTEILDVGAGNGTITCRLAERTQHIVGVDFSRNLLRRSPLVGQMVQGDAASLPFADDRFDVVVESNLLHHVSDPVAVLREMRRVTRRHIVLIEPNRLHPPMAAFMLLARVDRRGLQYDEQHIRDLAAAADLHVVAVEAQGAVYPNATPDRLLEPLARFDHPSRFGAYVVAVLEKEAR